MSKITHAFLHIPIFRELVPISTDAAGKWTIDDVPSATYQALGHERFNAWKNEVMNFINAGRVCGTPEGLMFEMLAAPNPEADWLCLQAFASESIKFLTDNTTDHTTIVGSIRQLALSFELTHVDDAGHHHPGAGK